MTPGTGSALRRPDWTTLRLVCGVDEQSTAVLPKSGGVVTFDAARFAVKDGERFGFSARVVRLSDGMPSEAVLGDALRVVVG